MALAWPSSGYCGHLENKIGWKNSLSLITLSPSSTWKIAVTQVQNAEYHQCFRLHNFSDSGVFPLNLGLSSQAKHESQLCFVQTYTCGLRVVLNGCVLTVTYLVSSDVEFSARAIL